MKTKLIFLILLIANLSCDTNKSVSNAEKDKMKGEIKEVVNTIFKGCEEANFDMAMESWLDSPDLVFIFNGVALDYKGIVDAMKPLFSTLLNQEVTIITEKYVFLDKSTVIYTTNCTFLENYKDGHATLSDPLVMQFTFMKINDKWKVINAVESSVRQDVKNSKISNELNQVELHKQFIGNWKGEVGKDTIGFWDVKSFGTGLECYFKDVTKGKIVIEGTQIWGYDKRVDKFILSSMIKGMDNEIYSTWFVSKNKCEMLPFSDVSNPDKAPLKWEVEIKSPDMFIQTTIVNNNSVKTDTYTRVK